MVDAIRSSKPFETNNEKLAAALIAGNSLSFNKEIASFGSEFFFRGYSPIEGINFCQFDFKACHLEKASFLECRFAQGKDVFFSGCKFLNGTRFEAGIFDSIDFSDCEFGALSVSSEMRNCSFLNCAFSHVKFHSAKFSGTLVVKNCHGFTTSRGLALSRDETTRRTFQKNSNNIHQTWVSWSNLRFLLELPLLKLSYIATLLMIVLMVNLGNLDRVGEEVISSEYWIEFPRVRAWLISILEYWNTEETQRSLSRNVAAFIFIAIGSTLFSFGCPEVVREYSRNKWTLEIGNGQYIYEAYSHSRFIICLLSLIFILIGSAYLAVKYAGPILNFVYEFGALLF